MQTTPQSRPWMVLIPLGFLVLLLLFSTTGKLLRTQARLILTPPHAYGCVLRQVGVKAAFMEDTDPGEEQRMLKDAEVSHTEDYQIRLAYSLFAEWSHEEDKPDERLKRLIELAGDDKFKAKPTLFAHILRYETEREVKVRRTAEYEDLVQDKEGNISADEARPPADFKERLFEFDLYAKAGEKLEPDNAYFSLMRAVGLFAAHNDAAAIDCILRASKKRVWEDHLDDELEADWRLERLAFDDDNPLLRSAIQGGVPSPHLIQLAAVGHMAICSAIQAEQAGDRKHGIEIRQAMTRCGHLMRIQSHTLAGSVIGADIVHDQINRPGGESPLVEDIENSFAERAQQRLDHYYAYLTKNGHPEEVPWMRQELAAGDVVRDIQSGAATNSLSPYGRSAKRLAAWWMADCVLLTNGLYFFALSLVVLPLALRKRSQNSWLALLLIGTFVLLFVISAQTQWCTALTGLRLVFTNWITSNTITQTSVSIPDSRFSSLMTSLFAPDSSRIPVVLFSLLGPVLLFATFLRTSKVNNTALPETIFRELPKRGSLLALIFLLLYSLTLVSTTREQSQLNNSLDQVIPSEGKYDAPLIGKSWPE